MPSDARAPAPEDTETGPRCIFCAAPWSAEMLRLYDAGANGAGCACCVIFPDFDEPIAAPPRVHVALPEELRCDACGRVLYRLARLEEAGPDA
jgi:hypothetical protein